MKYQVLFQTPDDIVRERPCLVQWIRVADAIMVCGDRTILLDLNIYYRKLTKSSDPLRSTASRNGCPA